MTVPAYSPMLATRWPAAFDHPDWWFEPKWDGVRMLVTIEQGSPVLRSRSGRDVTAVYPELGAITTRRAVVVDGEVVAFDQRGRPSFQLLQGRMNLSGPARAREAARLTPVHFMAFDLLYDGEELIGRPLEERRERLVALGLPNPAVLADGVDREGEALMRAVVAEGLEGIVAKRKGSVYRPGVRSADWRKVANVRRLRAVVGGFTPGTGARAGRFGALLVGLWDGEKLRWIGSVGTGFDDEALGSIRATLDQLARPECPFHPTPELPSEATWVEPDLVAEVEYKQFTSGGRLRAPSFKGFSDRASNEVTWEGEGPAEL